MNLNESCKEILIQLEDLINNISDEDFKKPSYTLNKASIGQHIRHTLEFFTCLKSQIETGVINYDKRDHDTLIESDKVLASAVVKRIKEFLNGIHSDQPLKLEANYSLTENESSIINTTLFREIAYNLEHAIHHMAIIKIGMKEVAPYVKLPVHFGVAVSTVKFQRFTQ